MTTQIADDSPTPADTTVEVASGNEAAGNRTNFERLTENIIHELVAALKTLR